jgi:EpsI family protein
MTGMRDLMPEEPLFRRRHVVFGGLLALASGVAYARMPVQTRTRIAAGALERLMPGDVGGWSYAAASGVVLPPSDALSDRLYDNVVTRVYTAPNAPSIMLLIAYSNMQDGLLQVHRPEFCYSAGGFALSPTAATEVTDSAGERYGANEFTATSVQRTEQVLYWTRIGESFPQSWVEQRLEVVGANLRSSVPDGLLARVSLLDEDSGKGFAIARQFVAAFDQASPTALRKILFGKSGTRPAKPTA